MKATLEQIITILAKEVDARVDVPGLMPDADLADQGIDSLDKSSIFLALEDEFGVSFTDEQIGELNTLNKILTCINVAA